jgi:uncharacterized protein YjbI with pentapeptide repeats
MIEIKDVAGQVLYTAENAQDVRAAVVKAVSEGADLRGADLQGADLQYAYLRGAYLRGADLQYAYLRGADLRGAYLQVADLRGADLQGADLRGAYLRGADLRGADLQYAYLRGADLQGELWNKVATLLRASLTAMNDSGRHWIKGQLTSKLPDGTQAYCSVGSVNAHADDGTVNTLALWLLGSVCAGPIEAFNDADQTTWEDVQAVFAVAIRHAERFAA